MKSLSYFEIIKFQKKYHIYEIQKLFESGEIWQFEGLVGSFGMDMINTGVVMHSKEKRYNFYGE